MKDLKVIFMGTPEFCVPILKELIDKCNVIAVVTQPDKEVGRKREIVYSPIKKVALENNIHSIAFPSISTGIYHFPLSLACPIALREMIERSSEMKEIVVYCFDDITYNTYVDTLNRLKGQR